MASDSDHLFACWHPVDGPATTTEGDRGSPRGPPPNPINRRNNGHLLEIVDAVREYPVTAGAILQRKVNSVKAVSGVNLHVDVGEALGLVGESGCGKTTLGKLIVGIEKPDARARSPWRAARCSACEAERCAVRDGTCR